MRPSLQNPKFPYVDLHEFFDAYASLRSRAPRLMSEEGELLGLKEGLVEHMKLIERCLSSDVYSNQTLPVLQPLRLQLVLCLW